MQKRQFRDDDEGDNAEEGENSKRAKREVGSTALVSVATSSTALTVSSKNITEPGRTSSLMAPEVVLLGHTGAVYSIAFDPLGEHLCSGSFDKQICECRVFFRFIGCTLYCPAANETFELSSILCCFFANFFCSFVGHQG